MKNNKCNIYIQVGDGDNISWVLKKFKRQCDTMGISKEYKKRKFHRKPSIREKEKTEAAQKRKLKEDRKKRRKEKI